MYRFKGFTEKANTALNLAIESAEALGHTYIGTEHIVLGLLQEGTGVAASVLGGRGVTAVQYQQKIVESESSGQHTRLTPEDFTPRAKKAMEMAVAEAAVMQHGYVGTEHILIAVLRDESSVAVRLIASLGARPDELMRDIGKAIGANPAQTASEGIRGGASSASKGPGKTPTLDQFGRDLTAMAKEGKLDPVIGQEKEIERVIQILSRRTKNNPCLIGEPGVGKIRHCGGPGPENRGRRGAGAAAGQAGGDAGPGRHGGRHQIPRRFRGTDQKRDRRGHPGEATSSCSSTKSTPSSARAPPRARWTRPIFSSRCSARRRELQVIGATTIGRIPQTHRKGRGPRTAVPAGYGRASRRPEEAILISQRAARQIRSAPQGENHRRGARGGGRPCRPAIFRTGILPDKAIDLVDEAASRVRLQSLYSSSGSEEAGGGGQAPVRRERRPRSTNEDFERAAQLRDEEKELAQKLEEQRGHWQEKNAEDYRRGIPPPISRKSCRAGRGCPVSTAH